MQTVYLHTQFGIMIPNFRMDDDNRNAIIINNHSIIRLESILGEYEEKNQKLLDLPFESFEIYIYEGVLPRIIIFIDNRRFEGIVSFQEIKGGFHIFA